MKLRCDRRAHMGCGLLVLGASLGALGCSYEDGVGLASVDPGLKAASPASAPRVESAEARAVVATLRSRFGSTHVLDARPTGSRRRATVTLPDRASDAFELTATSSGASARVALIGATDAASEVGNGFVVYRGGHRSGADVLQRLTSDGTEDYLSFERAPATEEIAYTVELGDGLAGARLFAGALELLDAAGTPRLRMSPPYVLDAVGTRHEARVAVSGCAVDSDPRPPWGRPVTRPGASICTVHVGWSGDGIRYPALVDPLWGTGGDLVVPRTLHSAVSLPGGRVMIVGGLIVTAMSASPSMSKVEIYDQGTNTWSLTASMLTGRNHPTATVLGDGRVLVTGSNYDPPEVSRSAEIYDPSMGTWSPAASMTGTRLGHTATLLANGTVLVVGCLGPPAPVAPEIYDPAFDAWSFTAPQKGTHQFHSATVLTNGTVLIVGAAGGNFPGEPELYEPGAKTWTWTGVAGGKTSLQHQFASLLGDGKVLVAGAPQGPKGSLKESSLYDPAKNTWSATAPLNTVFDVTSASSLANGKVLIVGYDGGAEIGSAEVYDPALGTWTNVAKLTFARWNNTTSALPNGQLLVAGGFDKAYVYPALTELFPFEGGSPCTTSDDCLSGLCTDGVCCSADCGGTASSSGGGGGDGGGKSSSVSASSGGQGGAGGAGGSSSPDMTLGGCGCRIAESSEDTPIGAIAMLGLAGALAKIRRRTPPCRRIRGR